MTRNRTRRWATLTAFAGVVALGVVIAFQTLPEVMEAGACAASDVVLRFEFAKTQADLEAIFGPAGSDCRAKVVAAMDAINTLDVALFIPAYTAFVAFGALFLTGGAPRPAAVAAIAAAVIALGADYVETFALLSYTPELGPTPAMLAQSSTAAWIKFAALGLNALALAALCFTATPRRRWILGALLCLPAIGVTAMFIDLSWTSAQTLGFLAGWTALLIMAIKSAIWGRG